MATFLKRLVDPFIILSMFYLILKFEGEPFNGHYLLYMILVFFVVSFVYDQIDFYKSLRNGQIFAFARNVAVGWLLIVAPLMLIDDATGFSLNYSAHAIHIWFMVTPFILFISHLAAHRFEIEQSKNNETHTALIVGANQPAVKICKKLAENPHYNIEVKGYFDDRIISRHNEKLTGSLLGTLNDITAYIKQNHINILFICLPISAQPRILALLEELQDTTVSIYFVPDIYTFELMQARLDHIDGVPVVGIRETPFTGINGEIKRVSDFVLAAIILVLLTPLLIVIALSVKLTSKGPVIFRQRRYGLNGEEIVVYKFRSMTVCEDGATIVQAQRNDQRITKLGDFLRKSSLDELPQFVNVLQGRMSIVGPRPHAVAHNELYRKLIKGYMLRHKVKPGITGWAQVHGLRGETNTLDKMQSRIEHDLDYLRNWTLLLDLWIILLTVREIFKKTNAY